MIHLRPYSFYETKVIIVEKVIEVSLNIVKKNIKKEMRIVENLIIFERFCIDC